MPSLLRLLVVLGLLGGLAYAAMFALANFVQPKPREITVTIPQERLAKPHLRPGGQHRGRLAERTMARSAKLSDGRLIELFLEMLAAERGAAKNTLEAYTRDLADFSAHLAAGGGAIAGASSEDVRAYLAGLAKRKFSPTSVARRLSAIRQIYQFLYLEGHRADHPATTIEGTTRGRLLPKMLSIAEVDRLLAAARARLEHPSEPSSEKLRAARLVCLLEILYATRLA